MKTNIINKVGANWGAVILMTFLVGVATLLLYFKDLDSTKKALVKDAQAQSQSLNLFVSKEYSGVLQDIYFFSKNPAYGQFLSEEVNPYISKVIEKTSGSFLQIRQLYSQFALLDSLGNEKLSINIFFNNRLLKKETPKSILEAELFTKIRGLGPDQAYVSPLRIVSSNGKPEAVVQFIMPVFYGVNGDKTGYICFNYSANRILDRLSDMEVKDSVSFSLIENKEEFIFNFNNRFKISENTSSIDSTLEESKYLEILKDGKNGLLELENDLFFAQPLNVFENLDSPFGQEVFGDGQYHILVHYTPVFLKALKRDLVLDKLWLAFIRIFVSSVVLLYFLRILRHKNKLLEEKSGALEKRNLELESSRERLELNLQRVRDFASEKNRAISTLKQKEKTLKQAQEIAQLGYYERDLVSGVSQWSDNLPAIFGLPSDYDFNKQSVENIMLKEEFEEVERAFDKAVEEIKEYKVVFKIYHKNGKVEYLQDIAKPVVKDGRVVSMKGTIQNLTERVHIEEELREAKIKAEEAVKAKSDFLATMSHEIRTPLNAVIGMSSLLTETSLDEKQVDFVETIKVSGNALLGVINDILDFSKIESGEMDLENQAFNLNKMIEDCLQVISVSAAQKHIKLFYKIDKSAPEIIFGDEGRIRQCIINLLNNAVKFTERGEVRILIQSEKIALDKCSIKVSIIDTGIGIEPEKQESIFSAFQQADSSITRKFGGTGLGLAITQKLIQLMGGSLKVKSEIDEGSEFYFQLEVNAKWEDIKRVAKIKKLIIVSNGGGEAETAKEIFEERGLEVTMMDSKSSDFEELEGRVFVMFCEEDEREMFIQLGEGLAASNNKIHFVCDIQKDMVGCKSFVLVNRPFKLSWVDQLIYGGNGENSPSKSEIKKDKKIKKDLKILVAEDNPVNQKLIRLLFQNLGYEIDLAEDGVMAVKAAQNKNYDLIFMDIQMPQMGGVEATRYIKEDHGESAPHIIALTANALDGDKEKYLKEGLDDYLSKPINMEDLKLKIENWEKNRPSKSEMG